jgi:hypothetical protein
MKRIILLFALVITLAHMARGQNFTVNGGLVISDVFFSVDSASIETNKNIGFIGGISGEIKLAENLYQGLGVEFVQKGFKIKSDYNTFSMRINYINFPFNLRYKFDLEDFWMAFEAGPFLGIALSGKTEHEEGSERLQFGSAEGQINYLDYGLNLGFGVEVDYFKLRVAHHIGLNNISSSQSEELKNKSFTLSVGILF